MKLKNLEKSDATTGWLSSGLSGANSVSFDGEFMFLFILADTTSARTFRTQAKSRHDQRAARLFRSSYPMSRSCRAHGNVGNRGEGALTADTAEQMIAIVATTGADTLAKGIRPVAPPRSQNAHPPPLVILINCFLKLRITSYNKNVSQVS